MQKISTTIILSLVCLYVSAQDFNLQFRSEVIFPYSCASIWGYVQDQHEYALVGTYDGVSIVDVTDPENPLDLFDVVHQGAASEWREIKTYGHYAYATNETGKGILIIDLQYLPDSVKQYQFIYDPPQGQNLTTGHTLWIDEKGRLFVFGGNGNGSPYSGYSCFDLTTDPLNPAFLGKRGSPYIHDGFVRGDTLWASEIYNGDEEVLNVSDPANPVSMAVFSTPSNFTHNAWPTSNNHYLFTTDEVNNSYLNSYDVSDLSNITELDKAQSNPGSQVIIHNVHLLNDQYAYTAYYKDGVVLWDVSHPDNMIEAGSYDTDPAESGGDYGGTWGVYPYLPSGNIISSDLYDGCSGTGKLTVLTPTYVTASWLEGSITDSTTGAPLINATVTVLSTPNSDLSNLSGIYKTGNGTPGTYNVQYSKAGYASKTIVTELTSGVVVSQDVQLAPVTNISGYTGQVVDAITNEPVASASLLFDGDINGDFTSTTDANGNFSVTSIFSGTYNVYAGKWGYVTVQVQNYNLSENSGPLIIKLYPGYYDDFLFNFSWISSGGNSTPGRWVRDEPIGTYDCSGYYNPEYDVQTDFGDKCMMTGNDGSSIGAQDVDNTVVKLTTPVFDLSNYGNPYISFYSWWVDAPFGGSTPDDTLHISLSNGSTSVALLNITAAESDDAWKYHSFKISDYIQPTNNMTLQLSAVDFDANGNSNWIEAAFDQFQVVDSFATETSSPALSTDHIAVYPNPFNDQNVIDFNFTESDFKEATISIYSSVGQLLRVYPVEVSHGNLSWGNDLAAGTYFITIAVNEEMKKMIPVVKMK